MYRQVQHKKCVLCTDHKINSDYAAMTYTGSDLCGDYVRPFVTPCQRLNRVADFHEIRYSSSLQKGVENACVSRKPTSGIILHFRE